MTDQPHLIDEVGGETYPIDEARWCSDARTSLAVSDLPGITRDRIDQATAEASQRATYILTIIAGIFLPLNLVAALLGANVGGVPWSEDGNGFTYLIVGSAVVTVLQLWILRRLKWI